MPTYDFRCNECSEVFEVFVSISEMGDPQECPECGSTDTKSIITPCNFVLRGDGWASKNSRINQQMAEKNRKLKAREREMKKDGQGIRLVPNVEGEKVESWTEAKKLAASKGKDTSGYEQQEHKEKEAAR